MRAGGCRNRDSLPTYTNESKAALVAFPEYRSA